MKQGVVPSKPRYKNWIIAIVAVICIISVAVYINKSKSDSIVGVWMDGTDKITFTRDGDFQMDSTYGTYTMDDDNTLILDCGEYSYHSGTWRLQYSSEAKEAEEDYWYMADGKLYLWGDEYTRK